jgi:hypothetical protein
VRGKGIFLIINTILDICYRSLCRCGQKNGPAAPLPVDPFRSVCRVGRSVLRPHGLGTAALWMQKNRTSLRPVCGATPQFFSMVSLANLAGTPAKLTMVFAV